MTTRLQKAALLCYLTDRLAANGSWCGETHIQKSTFFLQEEADLPTEFDFILYKHGPFSFDLRSELTSMRADGLVLLEPQYPYGSSYVTTENGRELKRHFPKTIARFKSRMEFIAQTLGPKNVAELEQLATVLYMMRKHPNKTSDFIAAKISEVKPHVSVTEAKRAVPQVQTVVGELKALY